MTKKREIKITKSKSSKNKNTKINKDGFIKTFLKKVPWLIREEAIPLHAAALTFFAIFSFLPLLILTYIIYDILSEGIATEFLFTTQEAMGSNTANTLINITSYLQTAQDHWLVYVMGIIIILYAASRFMYFLQKSMNHIWKVPTPKKWFQNEIRHRAISALSLLILMILATIVVLQKAAFKIIQSILGSYITTIIYYITITLTIYSLIAIIYKLVPDKKIEWNDVILGSVFSTIAFWVGYFLIKTVIRKSLVNSVYGAISGILLILLWTYYFAQIIYIGAEITKVYATHYGSMKDQKNKLIAEKSELEDENER